MECPEKINLYIYFIIFIKYVSKIDYYEWSEVIMSSSIKEIIIQFVFVFLVLSIIGYFIKSLELNLIKSLALSFGLAMVKLVAYIIKKSKKIK
ncbi:hypothetical protein [Clostridium vincentii]|nr:hypothetical protein [Clostridium vincentii]